MATPEFVLELRERVGTRPLWLSGVTAVVLRGDGTEREVLLVRRIDNGAWTPVTGIIDPGEEPAVAAVRETLEEASVVAVVERLAGVSVTDPITYPNGDRSQYLDLTFRCRYVSGEAAVGDDENSEVGWFRLDALPPMPAEQAERMEWALSDSPAAHFRS
jgi:8-oxo-dGTP pyrophosphatase MutT (NUDIX family)